MVAAPTSTPRTVANPADSRAARVTRTARGIMAPRRAALLACAAASCIHFAGGDLGAALIAHGAHVAAVLDVYAAMEAAITRGWNLPGPPWCCGACCGSLACFPCYSKPYQYVADKAALLLADAHIQDEAQPRRAGAFVETSALLRVDAAPSQPFAAAQGTRDDAHLSELSMILAAQGR